jgi:DNA-binding MarR family transcriptional regulator
MKQEETIDFHIRRNWYKIMRIYNLEAAKQNATMSMAYALLSIDFEDGTPSTSLGPKMGMESRSLTRMLKNMEEEGVIKRVADKNDKRVTRIVLTKKGKEKREQARHAVIQFNKVLQTKLSEKEKKGFFLVMNKINDILDENQIFEQIL